jgi:hypothetical protein
MPSRRRRESVAFVGPRRSWRKASVGPAAGPDASTASATADRQRLQQRTELREALPRELHGIKEAGGDVVALTKCRHSEHLEICRGKWLSVTFGPILGEWPNRGGDEVV